MSQKLAGEKFHVLKKAWLQYVHEEKEKQGEVGPLPKARRCRCDKSLTGIKAGVQQRWRNEREPYRARLRYRTRWTGGKGPLQKIPVDLIFCTKAFAKWHGINLRNPHVRFNFSTEHKGLYITGCSRSSLAREKKVESYFEEREWYEANLQQETLVVLEWYKAPVADL
jgi:hypothetical protein